MRKIKVILLSFIIILNTSMVSGCWNYRETDQLFIVAGMAIDKGKDDDIEMTLELVEFSNEKEAKFTSHTITLEGKTIFDTARNGISLLGKKLYWAHLKVIVISKQVAQEGVIKILDWINRDSETRADVNILISKGTTAKEIFLAPGRFGEIKAYRMREMMDNEKNLSKAPMIELWNFTESLAAKGMVAVAPTVKIKVINGKETPQILGTAVFKKDKLVGFLDEQETKDMLFLQDKIKGGVLVQIEVQNNQKTPISLEIFKSKTKIKPEIQEETIHFDVNINTITALDEIGGTFDFINDENRVRLEKSVGKSMAERMERLVKKMQVDYGADIFGFGTFIREDKPKVWKNFENKWDEEFQDSSVTVTMNVHIRNSAMLSKPLEIEE